ncbi:ABC transporter permease [Virgibacillus sp. NKC19-16]|uniref:ABC transporter permease n=1 Tax=Virgibacillus salidurans TaxID=2831673 RepID=UPI001F184B8B|nr:ABC transporter permease [Virgibacillus sp. NKC19-16]UJL46772.1 ABC transporter permease [Virgibacillus sp. NKC19-16]
MSNLIKAELFKLLRNKTFWVLIVTITGLSALLHYLVIIEWWHMTSPFSEVGLKEFNALGVFTIPLFFNLIVSSLVGFFISIEFLPTRVIKNQIISGRKRSQIFIAKFLVFSLGSIIVTILIPLLTAVFEVILLGHGDILSLPALQYLGRALGLFTLQFIAYTAITMLIAIITEDSGKTIIFSIALTIIMFAIEKLPKSQFITTVYVNSIFNQFNEVFKVTMTNGEIITSILIALMTLIIIAVCGIIIFNRKEIK